MNTLTVLLQQIGMFVIYIITGVILIRTKVLTRENLEIISKVVIKLSLPVMIFINTVNGVDRQSFFSSLSILGIAVVMYVCLLILGTLSGKVFHLHGEHLQLYRAMTRTIGSLSNGRIYLPDVQGAQGPQRQGHP